MQGLESALPHTQLLSPVMYHFIGDGPHLHLDSCFSNRSEDGADGRDADRHEPDGSKLSYWISLQITSSPLMSMICPRKGSRLPPSALLTLQCVSFSSYLYTFVHVLHPLIPTLINSQDSLDLKIRCGQLSDHCSQQDSHLWMCL